MELAGGRVLVTGGSSGIGFATATAIGRAGGRTVLLARGRPALEEASSRVPGCVGVIAADVADAAAMHLALEEAAQLLGGLDAVCAVAGAAAYGPFAEMAVDDYQRTLQTTLVGVVNTAHAALPHLQRTGGRLVVVGSVAGRVPVPWLAAYAAAKHGVRGFLRSLDAELRAQRHPVRVALIAPGPVDTPFWRRARTPDLRLPPEIRGAYAPQDVAAEVLRALGQPRRYPLERTVGGAMVPAVLLDALVPNLLAPPLGVLARLGWRRRQRRPFSGEDALGQPTVEVHARGGLRSRGSLLRRLRDLAS